MTKNDHFWPFLIKIWSILIDKNVGPEYDQIFRPPIAKIGKKCQKRVKKRVFCHFFTFWDEGILWKVRTWKSQVGVKIVKIPKFAKVLFIYDKMTIFTTFRGSKWSALFWKFLIFKNALNFISLKLSVLKNEKMLFFTFLKTFLSNDTYFSYPLPTNVFYLHLKNRSKIIKKYQKMWIFCVFFLIFVTKNDFWFGFV